MANLPEPDRHAQDGASRRWPIALRAVLSGIAVVFFLLVVTVIAGWYWLTGDAGRDWLRDQVVATVSDAHTQLRIDSISALSLRGVVLHGVRYDENGKNLLQLDRLDLGINPVAFVWGRIHLTEITVPELVFSGLPQGKDNAVSESKSGKQSFGLRIPYIRIDRIAATIILQDEQPMQRLQIKGNMLLYPARWWSSEIQLDVLRENDTPLVVLRYLPDKDKKQIYARIDDPDAMLLKRFAGIQDDGAVQLTLQGAMQDSSTWNGDLHFHAGRTVSVESALSLRALSTKPVLTFNGKIIPHHVMDDPVYLDGTLQQSGLDMTARLPEWQQGEMLLLNPVVHLAAQPLVRFGIHQGYSWQLNGSIDSVYRAVKEQSQGAMPLSQKINLSARGRLGRSVLDFSIQDSGNETLRLFAEGRYNLQRDDLQAQVSLVLHDAETSRMLGVAPEITTRISYDKAGIVRLDDGVLNAGPVQGKIRASYFPDGKILARLIAKTDGFAPYMDGHVDLDMRVNGTLNEALIAGRLQSSKIAILEDGDAQKQSAFVVRDVVLQTKGDLEKQQVTLEASLSDGDYRVQTDLQLKTEEVTRLVLDPLLIDLPDGTVSGTVQVVPDADNGGRIAVSARLAGNVQQQEVLLDTGFSLDRAQQGLSVLLEKLQLEWKSWRIHLQNSVALEQKATRYVWTPVQLDVNGASATLAGHYDPQDIAITADLRGLLLARSGLPLGAGTLDATARLSGPQDNPVAGVTLDLKNLVPEQLRKNNPSLALSGTVKADYAGGKTVIDAVLRGSGTMRSTARVTVPMQLLPFELREKDRLEGKLQGQLDLAALAMLPELDGHDLRGPVTLDVTLAGTPAAPDLAGTVRLDNGSYRNALYGTHLQKINAVADVTTRQIILRSFTARDDAQGTLSVSGRIVLEAPDNPVIDLAIAARRLDVVDTASLAATASADLTAKGMAQSLDVAGKVTIHSAEIHVNDLVGTGDPYRSYVIVEKGGQHGRKARLVQKAERGDAVSLDLTIQGKNGLYVRGPGLESEWTTALSLKGSLDRMRLEGYLAVLRGSYQFLDLVMRFDPKSKVVFSGDAENPELSLSGVIPGKTLDATLSVTGMLENPSIRLESSQGLPSDEILARVLFGRSASNLSAAQALQVARTLARLSGHDDSGFDPVGIMRQVLNVDTLGVSMGDDNGAGPTVSAGKYISDDVYISVEQGTTPNSSAVRSEVDVTKNIRLETRIDNAGDSKVGLQWVWDY